MKVTLNDISKKAGVDVVSVSYTLRDHPRAMELRPETREKIICAAHELGYRRNELAAAMRTGLNRTVAVIGRFEQIQNPDYDSAILGGILMEASRLDHGIKIYPESELDSSFEQILGHQIKHVISMSVEKQERSKTADLCRLHELKLVYIYEKAHGEFPTVSSANHAGAFDAVKYLASVGHQRIALICAPHQLFYPVEHHSGYLRALEDFGINADHRLICCEREYDVTSQEIDRMLRLPEKLRPTAFYCIADSWAMLVERSAVENGFKVPDDVSVIGCGNSMLAKCALAPLSSIAQQFGEIGRTALRLLLGHEADVNKTDDNRYLLPTRLIHRNSVKALTIHN